MMKKTEIVSWKNKLEVELDGYHEEKRKIENGELPCDIKRHEVLESCINTVHSQIVTLEEVLHPNR